MKDSQQLDIPVLFLIFNRPDVTEKVFEQIRKALPRQLFVAADGPRTTHPDDLVKCKKTRELVLDMIDWDCEVKTLFRDENLGCGLGVSKAISWFFEQVDQGIILEDDCLPSLSFFSFCSEMLKKYESDNRIMMVSGFNPIGKWQAEYVDYFFSDGWIWGWATWRRAWLLNDFTLSLYFANNDNNYYKNLLESRLIGSIEIFDQFRLGRTDTWDYQWYFARIINNGMAITPSLNLIENIGFDENATHTKWVFHPFKDVRAYELKFPLKENEFMIVDKEFKERVLIREQKEPSFFEKLKYRIRQILR